MERAHAFIHPEQSKSKKAIPIPLNEDAMRILKKQSGKHPVYVFTFKDKPVKACNTRAWQKALKRADIRDFRWHDLRDTRGRVGTCKTAQACRNCNNWVDGQIWIWYCVMRIFQVNT